MYVCICIYVCIFVFYGFVFFNQSHIPSILEDAQIMDRADIYKFIYIYGKFINIFRYAIMTKSYTMLNRI